MKKLVFAFAAIVAVSFASCGGNTTPAEAVDSVDSVVAEAVDSVDSTVAEVVDSAVAEVADSL